MTNQHWSHFVDFVTYERLTGGPDPHMRAVVHMCQDLSDEEKLWRTFLYAGVYNVPSAEAIWRQWPSRRYLTEGMLVLSWLEEHWEGLRLRRERRTVKSPFRLSEYLLGFVEITPERIASAKNFEELWDLAKGLKHVGRYAATKLTECWHRIGLTKHECPDIRAHGGWSPRAGLNLLFGPADVHDNSPVWVDNAELRAKKLHEWLGEHGIHLSMFELEVMLCEYKASYSTQRQYPGRSLDSELSYEAALLPYWGVSDTEHMKVRKLLSPQWALGELNGWSGVREELGHVLANHGYTWSDSIYDYNATTNFANPVRK